ncbi:MAG: pimeloyl-ACP methyl ester carboxylesterase [Myxococcota bacterium]|jgi:pimeloyl-ACP methyl ester carboxylesterase
MRLENAHRFLASCMPTLLERLGRWNMQRLGAESRFVKVNGSRVHLYDVPGTGSGADVALLHGVGSGATTFAPLIRRLRPHVRRLVIPEAPAHGYSGVPEAPLTPTALYDTMRAVLDAELPEGFTLYGNSLGGGTALKYACERGERVGQLALLSPAGAGTSQQELETLINKFTFRSRGDAWRLLQSLFDRPRWYHRLATPTLRRRLNQPAVRTFFEEASVDDQLTETDVASLSMPVLLMWGGAERLLPSAHLDWFKTHLPNSATIIEPAHFAHSAYIEYPDEVAATLVSALEGMVV